VFEGQFLAELGVEGFFVEVGVVVIGFVLGR